MYRETNIEERRKHKRFQINTKTFAAFVRPDSNRKIGEIIDMSSGGMAFRYLNYEKQPFGMLTSDTLVELDIFWDGDGYSLGTVPVKTISDAEISKTGPSSFITMRHCRMKFTELTSYQSLQLDNFIQKRAAR